jgi:hypothetical protein
MPARDAKGNAEFNSLPTKGALDTRTIFPPRLPQGGEGRGEEPMFTSTNSSPQPSPRLDGERELFPFGAGIKLRPPTKNN